MRTGFCANGRAFLLRRRVVGIAALALVVLPASQAAAEVDLRCTVQSVRGANPDEIGTSFDLTVNDDGTVSDNDTTFSNRLEYTGIAYRAEVSPQYVSFGLTRWGVSFDTTISRDTGNFQRDIRGEVEGVKKDMHEYGNCSKVASHRKF